MINRPRTTTSFCGECRNFIPGSNSVGYCEEFAEPTCAADSCPSFVRFESRGAESVADRLNQLAEQIAQACVDAEADSGGAIDRCGSCQHFGATPSTLPTGVYSRHIDVVLAQDTACLAFQITGGKQ